MCYEMDVWNCTVVLESVRDIMLLSLIEGN